MVQWQQWELLKYMVDNNMTPNLKYYTNLSRLSYKDYNAIELWKNFKSLSIDIGIDAMGKRCEYFRKNMNFDQTFKNIDMVLEEIPNSEISAVITFTWLNAINAVELFEWLFKNKPNVKITLNQVLHPHLDMQIAPSFKKEEISNALDKMFEIAKKYNYKDIDMVVGLNNYMWSEDRSHQFREAVEWLNELDKWRDQKFTDVFTEHQNILTYLADV
jgi:pyruvate-formate lyase-activating enzyme